MELPEKAASQTVQEDWRSSTDQEIQEQPEKVRTADLRLKLIGNSILHSEFSKISATLGDRSYFLIGRRDDPF